MEETEEKVRNMSEQKKLPSLQALRALAFIGIFTCHAGLTQLGAWGASVFLVLSGFLMVYTYYDRELDTSPKGAVRFAAKKIGKLYPLHIIMLVAALPFVVRGLIQAFSLHGLVKAGAQVVLNALLLQSWIPKSASYFSLNGVTWYLSICVFLYLMFPYLLKVIQRYRGRVIACVSIVIVFCVQFGIAFLLRNMTVPMSVSDNLAKWVTYICPVFRLGDFFIGCNLGYLFLKRKGSLPMVVASIGEILVLLALVVSQKIFNGHYGFFSTEWFILTVLYVPTSALLVYLFAAKEGILTGLLTNPVLIAIGNVSGSAFLIHQIVIRYLWEIRARVGGTWFNNWVVLVLAAGITGLLIWIYQQAEKKFRKPGAKKKEETKQGAAA